MAYSSRYHYLIKLVVISSRSFCMFRKSSVFLLFPTAFLMSLTTQIFSCRQFVTKLNASFSITSDYSMRASQQRASYKFVLAKLPAQFVHITHILVDARLVSRFHGFHRRFSHESRLMSMTHTVAFKFQPLSVCTCFILI